jgi:hypothetical protein
VTACARAADSCSVLLPASRCRSSRSADETPGRVPPETARAGDDVSAPGRLAPSERLDPELIPEPLWAISAARLFGRKSKSWRPIRSSALESAGDTCSACREMIPGGKGMVCDELWSYDEGQKVATLTGVRILCPGCDLAHHFARGSSVSAAMLLPRSRVNGISGEQARALQAEATAVWRRHSALAWTVRVSEPFLAACPALAPLNGQHGAPGQGQAKVKRADQQAARR